MNAPTQGLRTVSLFLLLSAMHPAIAELYKCPQADGTPLFSDAPCVGGGGETIELQENTALDSSSVGSYAGSKPASRSAGGGQAIFIEDEETQLRNARITARERAAEKRRLKHRKKRAKQNKK